MRHTVKNLLVVTAMLATPSYALAEAVKHVDHARIKVSDVVAHTPASVGETDLGPAPPPGGSRLLGKDEIEGALRRAGHSPAGLKVPASIRVVSASRRLTTRAVAELSTPALTSALPRGVTLKKVEPTADVTVPPRATVKGASLPSLPRRKGETRVTATVELESDGEIVARLPVPILVDVSDEAARPDVARGGRINLVIEHRGVRITASATVVGDANVGDLAGVQITSTGKTVRARITTKDEAQLAERP